MKITKKYSEIPKTYRQLLDLFMLRPIHDVHELENATEVIEMLAGHDLNKDQEDYLEALSTFIEEYELEHYPLPESKMSGIEILRYLLEENGMNASDLSRLLSSHRTLGSRILSGGRKLTADHIKILCHRFKVSADIFLND